MNKTLAQIQSTFTQAIDDLKELISRNSGEISTNNHTISSLQNTNRGLDAENAKARKFQGKLEGLLK